MAPTWDVPVLLLTKETSCSLINHSLRARPAFKYICRRFLPFTSIFHQVFINQVTNVIVNKHYKMLPLDVDSFRHCETKCMDVCFRLLSWRGSVWSVLYHGERGHPRLGLPGGPQVPNVAARLQHVGRLLRRRAWTRYAHVYSWIRLIRIVQNCTIKQYE